MGRKRIPTTVYIEPRQRAAVEELARAQGIALSEVFRQSLDHVIARRERQLLAPDVEEICAEAEEALTQSLVLHPKVVRFAHVVTVLQENHRDLALALDLEREETARLRAQLATIKTRVTDALEGKPCPKD